MEPISCVNCCHNPLQIGNVGTPFGYCQRHRLVLDDARNSTCGHLLRKDLPIEMAEAERDAHAKIVGSDHPYELHDIGIKKRARVEVVRGQLPVDAVVDEVVGYGQLGAKIATLAALRRIPGGRAEVALSSLGRSYVSNCVRRDGSWTSGVHLLWWTLHRLPESPMLELTDLREMNGLNVLRAYSIARWYVVLSRLLLVSDIGFHASKCGDDLGALSMLADAAISQTEPGSSSDLTEWLMSKRDRIQRIFPRRRYEQMANALRAVEPD